MTGQSRQRDECTLLRQVCAGAGPGVGSADPFASTGRCWLAGCGRWRAPLPRWGALPMTISPRVPNIAIMRSTSFAAAAAAATIGTLLVTGCSPDAAPHPSTTSTGPAARTATGTPRAADATSAPRIPISVESDHQMKAEGNNGPSSSILLPTSCRVTGTTVTAEGTYTNGGLVPNVYNRYGDIIVLYVRAAPSPGYAQGMQLGASDVFESPAVGSGAPWHVSLSIAGSAGVPARCVVAAQPTHDGQFAP